MSGAVLFVVNDLASFREVQSTWALATRLAEWRVPVHAAGAADLFVQEDGAVGAVARRMSADGPDDEEEVVWLDRVAVWARFNPGRSRNARAFRIAMEALALAESRGTVVRNTSAALWRAGSKLCLMGLPPGCRPRSVVACRTDVLLERWREMGGPVVLKPLVGTQGRGVVRVNPQREDVRASLEAYGVHRGVMLQEFLRRAGEGDIRVHLVGGRPLEVDGKRAIVRRVPRPGEFRSNVALGGVAEPAEWSEELERTVALAGPALVEMGLWHVGLDVVGGRVVEINAYSPGGVGDAGRFAGVDFVGALARAFLDEIG